MRTLSYLIALATLGAVLFFAVGFIATLATL